MIRLSPIKNVRLILGLLVGILVLIGFQVFTRRPLPPPSPTPESISPLPLTPMIKDQNPQTIKTQISPQNILPSTSYLYKVESLINPSSILSPFNMTEENIVTARTTANFFMWFRKGLDQLTFSLKPSPSIYYQKEAIPSPAPTTLSQDQFVSAANDVINTYIQPLSDYPITIDWVELLQTKASNYWVVKNLREADTVKFYLKCTLDDHQFVVNTRPLGVGTITLNFDGSLNNLTFSPPPKIISQEVVSPLSPVDAISALKAGKGTLILALTNQFTEFDFVPDFTTINISNQEYISLYRPEENLVIPAYLFKGRAQDKTSKLMYQITYIVPAINL